ncbi:hypothetical protein BT96DRAFT_1015734 [Gymnopus androsaceus JB14]|uniref:Uncharacterized protein n=1 Tax=Gymnopus androsaceus JB14 TaxID=1447944 RepID=A0A6A4I445_9AGAR|nr:hypothetical protein BT96DRAFT_1015734 [Gymnopus androsaceus JB14]
MASECSAAAAGSGVEAIGGEGYSSLWLSAFAVTAFRNPPSSCPALLRWCSQCEWCPEGGTPSFWMVRMLIRRSLIPGLWCSKAGTATRRTGGFGSPQQPSKSPWYIVLATWASFAAGAPSFTSIPLPSLSFLTVKHAIPITKFVMSSIVDVQNVGDERHKKSSAHEERRKMEC